MATISLEFFKTGSALTTGETSTGFSKSKSFKDFSNNNIITTCDEEGNIISISKSNKSLYEYTFNYTLQEDRYNILNEGTAITIRIKHGINVHKTSTGTLWVLFEGTGFADALNLIQA